MGDVSLLIGVMSFKSPAALARREAMRSMHRGSPNFALRFVLSTATPDLDAAAEDMLLLHVNESGRALGTYLLNNAFFRHAVALRPRVPFIARADDDSFFDVPSIMAELLSAVSCSFPASSFNGSEGGPLAWSKPTSSVPTLRGVGTMRWVAARRSWRWFPTKRSGCTPDPLTAADISARRRRHPSIAAAFEEHLVYGHFQEWYSWAPKSLMPACFAFGHYRNDVAEIRNRQVNGHAETLPRHQRECLHSDLVGPFPYAAAVVEPSFETLVVVNNGLNPLLTLSLLTLSLLTL